MVYYNSRMALRKGKPLARDQGGLPGEGGGSTLLCSPPKDTSMIDTTEGRFGSGGAEAVAGGHHLLAVPGGGHEVSSVASSCLLGLHSELFL